MQLATGFIGFEKTGCKAYAAAATDVAQLFDNLYGEVTIDTDKRGVRYAGQVLYRPVCRQAVDFDESDAEVFVEGVSNLLNLPEFSDLDLFS